MKAIVFFLFLLNFITSLLFINEGLFHFDSVVLAQAVEKTYATGMLHPAHKGRYGSVIINAIMHLPFHILGKNADFTVRLSSILFHSLSIVALFLFVEALFNNRILALFLHYYYHLLHFIYRLIPMAKNTAVVYSFFFFLFIYSAAA